MITNCCPAATALPTIPAEACAQNFGQIQKIIFQRIMNGSTKNSIADGTSAGNAGLLASWTALKAAADSTKIAVTPFIEAPADDGGDARTYGDGSNDTLNGAGIIIGSNPVNFTCRLNGKKQDIIAELKKLICEALANNLGVYLVNENGNIGHQGRQQLVSYPHPEALCERQVARQLRRPRLQQYVVLVCPWLQRQAGCVGARRFGSGSLMGFMGLMGLMG